MATRVSKEEQDLLDQIHSCSDQQLKGDFSRGDALNDWLEIAQRKGYQMAEVKALLALAEEQKVKRDLPKSMLFIDAAIKIADRINDKQELATAYNQKANIFSRMEDHENCIAFYFKALRGFEEMNDRMRMAKVYTNIGNVFYVPLKNKEKGGEYLHKAWEIFQTFDDKKENWLILFNLGEYYKDIKNDEKSQYYYELSFQSALTEKNAVGISFGQRNLAQRNKRMQNYPLALQYINECIKTIKKYNIHSLLYSSYLEKATILMKSGKLKESEKILLETTPLLKRNRMIEAAYNLLMQIKETEEDFEASYHYYELAKKQAKKVVDIKASKHIDLLEAKFQNKLKEREKEILRLQKIEMEQKALRAQLNPHFFFNCLNSINKYITENDKENAVNFLQRFGRLMQSTLENSEDSIITIQDEILFLSDYLSLERMRFNNSFKFDIQIEENIDANVVKIPSMMLQPYVENSIKHGVNGITDGWIKIRFSVGDNGRIHCLVEDNGKGLQQAKQQENHRSMSTKILADRMEALELQYNIELKINMEEIVTNGSVNGTRVAIFLPDMNTVLNE